MAVPKSRLKTLKQEKRSDPATKKKRSKAATVANILRSDIKDWTARRDKGAMNNKARRKKTKEFISGRAREEGKVPPRG